MAKKDIHPELYLVCYRDVSTGRLFKTVSTYSNSKKNKRKVIDGVDYEEVICDVTMDSHAAYTTDGEKQIKSKGRAEDFKNKFRRRG